MDLNSHTAKNDIIGKSTVRVETPNGKGSGVLFSIASTKKTYLLTAKHCLYGVSFDKDLKTDEIELTLFDSSKCNLNQLCKVFIPHKLDIVVIELDPKFSINSFDLKLLNTAYFNGKCSFTGYPNAFNSEKQIGLNAEYSGNKIISVNAPLFTLESDPYYNVKGFSGSGVFCHVDNEIYLSGILTKYLGTFQRFEIVDLSFLKEIDEINSITPNLFSSLPDLAIFKKDINKFLLKSERNFESIRFKLANKFHVVRDQITQEFKNKINSYDSVIITGAAGTGKSAFSKSILAELEENGRYFPLVFKAEEFAKSSVDAVFDYLENKIEDILKEVGKECQLIILIDSAEKLLEIEDYSALKEFIGIVKSIKGVKVVISCRTYAYQQLLYDLYNYLPSYRTIEVLPFKENELRKVISVFPKIESVVSQPKLRKIVSKAFYLNLAVSHAEQFLQEEKLTELEFKRIIWEEIISKRSQSRGQTFEKIAVERALSMKSFIKIEDLDPILINELEKDDIIDLEEQLHESYRATHDIYEDIALIRYVERLYQNKESNLDFFEKLGGKQPALRRAFRLWLFSYLENNTEDLSVLIEDMICTKDLEQFWRDELLISILKSQYSAKFFKTYHKIISKDSFNLLLHLIRLLRTSCQIPDEVLSKFLTYSEISANNSDVFLKPTGHGWTVMIDYICENIKEVQDHVNPILDLIIKDWSNKLSWDKSLPAETEAVRDILLFYVECIKRSDKGEIDFKLSDKHIKGIVKLLIRTAKVSKSSLKILIQESYLFEPKRVRGYQLRSLYSELTKVCLSGLESRGICEELPDLVIELAKKKWFITESNKESWSGSFDIESDFGLTDSHEFSYFPASMYKTPVRFLLWFHPKKALQFIIELINHTTNSYSESERGRRSKISEITITTLKGARTKQIGNEVIWGMYRGFVESVPYLLTSVLMILEEWLLDQCKSESEKSERNLKIVFEFLLTNSESVAVTSVLAAISLAYPEKVGRKAVPILGVKEFYEWDRRRYIGDQNPLAPWDQNLQFAQNHVHKFNELPHRRKHLEQLVSMLQVYGHSKEVNKILDDFMESSKGDPNWQLVISRMDFRNFRIDESISFEEENKVAFSPQIDPKLQKAIDSQEDTKALLVGNQILSITNWALLALEGKDEKPKYEEWKEKYETFNRIVYSNQKSAWPFGDPLNIAICGLNFFNDNLTKEEFLWAYEIVIEVLKVKILRSLNGDFMSPIGALSHHLNTFLPQILTLNLTKKQRKETKELIFLSLIHFQNYEKEQLFESFRNKVWVIDSEFAQSCVDGLFEYSQMCWDIIVNRRKEQRTDYTISKLKKEYSNLVQNVVNNNLSINLKSYQVDTCSLHYLIQGTLLIPDSSKNENHIKYFITVLEAIVSNLLDYDRGNLFGNDFSNRQKFRRVLARLILQTEEKYSTQIFEIVLYHLFKEREKWERELDEFIERFLDDIIHSQSEIKGNRFWLLWEILEKQLRLKKEKRIIKYLFLSSKWWGSNEVDWLPLLGKKNYYEKLTHEFGHYNIDSALKLLSGIGATQLLPEGIIWIKNVFESKPSLKSFDEESNRFLYLEKLIGNVSHIHLTSIKNDKDLRNSFLYILDLLIQNGSSKAYNIKERFISIGN